jgi:cytochrome P450
VGRGDLTNGQWERLEPLLPVGKKPGRPRTWTHRQLIDGIRWRTRTGTPWRDLPERYGPWDRAYDLFRRWQRDGTWKRISTPVMPAAALGAEDGETWANVVEEGLRNSPPVRHVILRYAVTDTEIAGVRVAKGDAVLASVVPAGRDTGRHEHPDAFDIARTTSREHVAFGFGAHYCLGVRLAKLETEIALRALLRRYPILELASDPARLTSISLQGYQSLPVHLHGGDGTPTGALSVGRDAAVTA